MQQSELRKLETALFAKAWAYLESERQKCPILSHVEMREGPLSEGCGVYGEWMESDGTEAGMLERTEQLMSRLLDRARLVVADSVQRAEYQQLVAAAPPGNRFLLKSGLEYMMSDAGPLATFLPPSGVWVRKNERGYIGTYQMSFVPGLPLLSLQQTEGQEINVHSCHNTIFVAD